MDLWDIGRMLARRWYFFLPLLSATALVTWQTGHHVRPEFTATGAVLLIPPTGTPPPDAPIPPGNPWAKVGPVAMAQAITIIYESPRQREETARHGWDPDYDLSIVPRSAIITITVTSKRAQQAQGTVQYILAALVREIDTKQRAFADHPSLRITTEILDDASSAHTVTTRVRRAQIAIAGVGLLAAIALTIAADALIGLLYRRR